MSRSGTPKWYTSGDIEASLQAAFQTSGLSVDEIAGVLATHELDASRDRIEKMIKTTREQFSANAAATQPSTATLDEPRPTEPRAIAPTDIEYLGPRDAAYVIGAMLSRYEGTFSTPEAVDELSVDLFWNRTHTTVAFGIELRPDSEPVDTPAVQSIVTGETTPVSGRSPSTIGIISNGTFTNEAQAIATEHDIRCFEAEYLERWCEETRLTDGVIGKLLDEGDQSIEEIGELLDELPSLPAPVRERDPLTRIQETDWTTSTIEYEKTAGQDGSGDSEKSGVDDDDSIDTPSTTGPTDDESPDTGQHGVLYADPDEDGDFGAFDRFETALDEGSQE